MSPAISAGNAKEPKMAIIDNKLPTCRNYWRFGGSPSPPQRPSSYLLKPHLIASSASSDGRNPNSKYYKLRHGPGAAQFSPLTDDMINYHQYRIRLPFDPSPFRGVTRFAFWILFLSILILLVVLITALFQVEDLHDHDQHHIKQQQLPVSTSTDDDNDNVDKSLKKSIIFRTLLNRYVS